MFVAQETIAGELALSRSTVSRSLSGHASIHPTTRARVLMKAEELGYLGREHKRGRKASETKLAHVGVLIATGSFAHSPHPEAGQTMLAGLSDAAAARDMILDTHFVDAANVDRLLDVNRRPAGWRKKSWRGCILIYQHSAGVVESLLQSMAVVSLVNQYEDLPVDCIDVDPFSGMNQLISELAALGHRRVGYLSMPPVLATPSWVYSRFGGFLQAIAREGLEMIPGAYFNVLKGQLTPKAKEVDDVMAAIRKHKITALVCGTDFLARRLYEGLTARGLEVPGDFSITGFDGVLLPLETPELTTIRSPLHEMGVAALMRLGNRIQNPSRPIRHILHQGAWVPGKTISPRNPTETT